MMQPPLAAPRDTGTLTAAQITALIEADELNVVPGLELLDEDDAFIDDISADLEGGEVESGNYRTIHRTCKLTIARELVWANQRVKPYVTLSTPAAQPQDDTLATEGSAGGGDLLLETGDRTLLETGDAVLLDAPASGDPDDLTTEDDDLIELDQVAPSDTVARFNLGVFLLSTPATVSESAAFEVEGYDKLEVLAQPHAASHSVAAGTAYLTAVTDLLTAAGESKWIVDPTEIATTVPSTMTWPLDETTTTLQIINDLLAAVNYRALWVDWDGYYRLTPYVSPSTAAPEWTYDADDPATTIVGEARRRERDFFGVPNRWVGIRNDPTDSIPTDGDGRYETVNQSDGDTSIDARGRTITKPLFLDAASQASLVAQVDAAKEEDMRVNAYRQFTSGPNPLHWHFDVGRMVDAELGATVSVTWISWRLPLDGGDMTHETREV